MKEYVRSLVEAAHSPLEAKNRVREYLQARILQSLQQSGAMIPLAFHGGTALRFLFGLPRYSEDLDFALEQAGDRYDFRGYLTSIRAGMESEGYRVSLRVKDDKTVHSAFVGFPGLLNELRLSPHPDETLSVKLEVDTNPPSGAVLTTTVVRRHVILHMRHHDRASLFAGKLHAILQRPYLKGRDIYDLIWYLSDPDWPVPNLSLLNNALQQTGWRGESLTEATWRPVARDRIKSLDWSRVEQDIAPFIENAREMMLINRETLERLLIR